MAEVRCRIISQVLSGDSSELRKRAKAIESDKDAPSKEHLACLKAYGMKPAEEQQVRDHPKSYFQIMPFALSKPFYGELVTHTLLRPVRTRRDSLIAEVYHRVQGFGPRAFA